MTGHVKGCETPARRLSLDDVQRRPEGRCLTSLGGGNRGGYPGGCSGHWRYGDSGALQAMDVGARLRCTGTARVELIGCHAAQRMQRCVPLALASPSLQGTRDDPADASRSFIGVGGKLEFKPVMGLVGRGFLHLG